MKYYINNLKYFEKPGGVDIFAEIYRDADKIGWLEQAAYDAPAVYFYSVEKKENFVSEMGDESNWDVIVEEMIQDCERKFYGPEQYDKMLKEVLNG